MHILMYAHTFCTCVYTCMFVGVHISMSVGIYIYLRNAEICRVRKFYVYSMYVYVGMCKHVCMHACMYVCIWMYRYKYI